MCFFLFICKFAFAQGKSYICMAFLGLMLREKRWFNGRWKYLHRLMEISPTVVGLFSTDHWKVAASRCQEGATKGQSTLDRTVGGIKQ